MKHKSDVSWSVDSNDEQISLRIGRQENFMSPEAAEEMRDLLDSELEKF